MSGGGHPAGAGPAAGAAAPAPVRVDAHHHLWDLSRRAQPWMDGPWADPIRRTFALPDLAPHLSAHRIDASVVVQACSSVEETRELLALAAESDTVAGVVGWADLTGPGLPGVLASLPSGLVGVRHQVQDEADPDWLTRPEVLRGLAAVADAGLVFDLLVGHGQLAAAQRAVRELPQLTFVLDHAAKPAVATGAREPWARGVAGLAALPNVVCKLSGLVTEADWRTWTPKQVLPWAREVIDLFGPHRLMFGSDWPVCTLAAGYDQVVELAETALAGLDEAERSAVFGGTARRVYGL